MAAVVGAGVEDVGAEKTACAAATISDGTFFGMCGVVVVAAAVKGGAGGGAVEVVAGTPAEEEGAG